MLTIAYIGDPDKPQNVRFYQKVDSNGKCDLFLLWNPPSNIATVTVNYYLIYFDGRDIMNETAQMEQTSMFVMYTSTILCACGIRTVSISAVNRCGRAGQRTTDIDVMDTNSLINELSVECNLTTTSETHQRPEGKCFLPVCSKLECCCISRQLHNYSLQVLTVLGYW